VATGGQAPPDFHDSYAAYLCFRREILGKKKDPHN
jgi:hypothetical protein